jgi:hypothetical protein
MLKRVLKPDDTHLMAPDEEYCRVIYERQWNAPNMFDLSIEVFDKGGVRVRKSYSKITPDHEKDIIQEVLGDGWETIFMQNYDDWMIRCQKRPRSTSQSPKYLPASMGSGESPLWRQVVIAGAGVGAIALAIAWIAGQFPQPTTVANDSEELAIPGSNLNADGLDADANPEGTNPSSPAEEPLDAPLLTDDILDGSPNTNNDSTPLDTVEPSSDESSVTGDGVNAGNTNDEESSEGATSGSAAVTGDASRDGGAETEEEGDRPNNTDPFVLAVRLAQQAVQDGEVAETQEEWEALAVKWQEAADLMAAVPADDERYAIAQDRIDVYEANRDIALSEAEKADTDT